VLENLTIKKVKPVSFSADLSPIAEPIVFKRTTNTKAKNREDISERNGIDVLLVIAKINEPIANNKKASVISKVILTVADFVDLKEIKYFALSGFIASYASKKAGDNSDNDDLIMAFIIIKTNKRIRIAIDNSI
jgi:hypothetical protein